MKIVFTPNWFLDFDVAIGLFSFLVLFVFFLLSKKSFKITKNKNSTYLGYGFLLVALGELATIFTKVILYYDTTITHTVGKAIISYSIVKSVDFFYYAGFFFQRFLTLLGFYVIYMIPKKSKEGNVWITAYFILISVFLSQFFYYVYHITIGIFLILIIDNYYKIYNKNKNANTQILIWVFSILLIGHLIFVPSKVAIFYVTGQAMQLISYVLLVILFIRINYGKKKNKT